MSQRPDERARAAGPSLAGPSLGSPPGPPPDASWWHRRWVWALAVLVPVAVAGAVIAFAVSDNNGTGKSAAPTTAPSSTETPTTEATTTTARAITTAPSATTVTTAKPSVTTVVPVDATAVWPAATSSVRYGSPTDAARGFATELVGFVDPVVGSFRQGDTRSGEVDVRAKNGAPVTTVLVRQLGSDGSPMIQPPPPYREPGAALTRRAGPLVRQGR